jgi:hypothetical protein
MKKGSGLLRQKGSGLLILKVESNTFGCELLLAPRKAESLSKVFLRYYNDKEAWKFNSFLKVQFIHIEL